MGDEEKDLIQEKESQPEPEETGTENSEPDEGLETAEEQVPPNHVAEKRGRMVAAGLIAAVIVAVIAVVVAALFQFSSRWLVSCPWVPAVNDPAPILWKNLTSTQDKTVPLGVSPDLARKASWKGPDTKN